MPTISKSIIDYQRLQQVSSYVVWLGKIEFNSLVLAFMEPIISLVRLGYNNVKQQKQMTPGNWGQKKTITLVKNS